MPLETATYINQLDAANPLGSDPISAGDDHLRLIKSAVKATFPNITGPVTATQAELNAVTGNVSGIQTLLNNSKLIKQVVTSVVSTRTLSTSSSYVDSPVTASITPTSASSQILILVSASAYIGDQTSELQSRLVRGAIEVAGSYRLTRANVASPTYAWTPIAFMVTDTPNTTSPVTYKVQQKVAGSSGTISFGSADTNASCIILVEIL